MKKLFLCLSLVFMPIFAMAASYVAGDQISPISLLDQNDKPLNVTDDTKVVLFSRSMKGGEIIKETLAPLTPEQFPKNLVYIADISDMPSLIAKFVAIPKMKEFSFAIGLDREGDISRLLPDTKDMATMIVLKQLSIQDIAYFDSSEALAQALAKLPQSE
ncbi:hypothetical protein [Shewanella acanthi]|uniref:hypothetical protein n=1 Tax=Shewanella acanthi TaxID=2864212 RepID=UPI001C6557CC|nr:hypothetical protein [Shewanella acanthi]QYJ78495.1 hypothetical protein K0H61_15575 [Shewanella acanthi]